MDSRRDNASAMTLSRPGLWTSWTLNLWMYWDARTSRRFKRSVDVDLRDVCFAIATVALWSVKITGAASAASTMWRVLRNAQTRQAISISVGQYRFSAGFSCLERNMTGCTLRRFDVALGVLHMADRWCPSGLGSKLALAKPLVLRNIQRSRNGGEMWHERPIVVHKCESCFQLL